ncbi:MAG: hypothetical protein NTU48_10145 [Legionellales bacterium]|nr:hypothetical protein [Legionellales bacterium]
MIIPPNIEEQKEIETSNVDERISDRIVNNNALFFMRNLPEAGTCFEPPTTILTPEGAFQWNPEINNGFVELVQRNLMELMLI